ncbi:glutamyl-tRNA reductase [Umboniibacter marinipuniceus]
MERDQTSMPLLAIGFNHKSASLALREQLAFAPDALQHAHRELCSSSHADEAVIISTCNRTEIVVHGACNVTEITEWLAEFHQVSAEELSASLYSYSDRDAVAHLMKVASGLDSLVLGEPQILGQVKSAFAVATEAGTVTGAFHQLFQQVFSAAKRVRSQTAIGSSPVSVAYAAVSLAQRIFSDLSSTHALLIGAGETIDLVAQHLHQQGVASMVVANRTLARAEDVAARFQARGVLLSEIPDHLPKADIIISSTASQLPVLGKGTVETAMTKRRHRPQFMVDIAVPRDIEAEVGQLEDVYLYTVDDLANVINDGLAAREQAATQAVKIIDEQVDHYLKHLRAQDAVDTIKAFRQQISEHKDIELERAVKLLARGEDPELVLNQFARALTNKIVHQPTNALSQAGREGRLDVIEWSRELFGIDGEPS